jgi:hypothetical protein
MRIDMLPARRVFAVFANAVLFAIGIYLTTASAEGLFPLGGAIQAIGNECALVSLPWMAGKGFLKEGKEDLAELGKVYDPENEPWDDFTPFLPPRKVKFLVRLYQAMPLSNAAIVACFQGFTFFTIASIVIFIAMYRFIPRILLKFYKILLACIDVAVKLAMFKKKGEI